MLPHSYELPAAILLVLGGALSCFAGYRLFKIVLGIYGFVLGAMLASSTMGVTNSTGMIVASLVGGVCGALLLMFAYFVGIALVGQGWARSSRTWRGAPSAGPAIRRQSPSSCCRSSDRSARCSCSGT